MGVKIRRVDLTNLRPEDSQGIAEVLAKSANATVFHAVEWNHLLVENFGLAKVTLLATVGGEPARRTKQVEVDSKDVRFVVDQAKDRG
jgi:hypothetical protein